MATHPLASKPAPRELLVNVPRLVSAYYTGKPDASVPEQQVAFGTSGHGGPADTQTTKQIQDRANQLLAGRLKEIRRMPLARALKAETTHMYDYVAPYVADLGSVIGMRAIAAAGLAIGVDPMGGAALGF